MIYQVAFGGKVVPCRELGKEVGGYSDCGKVCFVFFLAILIILVMLSFRSSALGPLCGMVHVCKKGLFIASSTNLGGAVASIVWSVMATQECCMGEKLRYNFSHMILIASFLDSMSRIFRPPSLIGYCRVCAAILGLDSLPHRKSLINLVNAFSISCGIPWAFIRNWVWPPTMAWMTSHFLFRVG